ncbi:MAG: FtsX-like permease family protein [Pseudomonadota bacterium]
MKAFKLVLRSLQRDWRSAEVRILMLALVVAVAAVTAVSFFTNRIDRVMDLQTAELLGADLRVSSADALPSAFVDEAHRHGLHTAQFWEFPSVILHDEETALISVKAVTERYPLRGQLQVAEQLYGTETVTTEIPASGQLWLETRLLAQLGLQVGESLDLGEMHFTIAKVLTYEPDRGGLFFQLAPRVLMNLDDVEKTKLVSLGSRVRYQLLVAGDKITEYRTWLEPQIQAGQQIQGVEDSRPELRSALERAERFLGLAALIAVILAGAAVAVAAQHFSQRQADASAIMRCLGATQKFILQIYLLRMLSLGLLASSIGCVLGWLAQAALSALLANYFATAALPAPSVTPVLVGFATGLITLLGFALLPLLRIHTVPPLRVLRRELGATPLAVWQVVGIASLAMALLMFWQAGDTKLALLMIAGTFLTLLILTGAAYGLVHSLRLFRHQAGVTWRFGLANLARRSEASSVQLAAFGLGIMALLLLAVVRVDLLETWQDNLPEGLPNHFLINIQKDGVESLQAKLSEPQYNSSGMYPMLVGRFIAINDQPVLAKNYTSNRAKRFATRSFNLSSAEMLPKDNNIVAGRFWNSEPGQLSVEAGFAKEMGINLGDTLHFSIAGQEVSAKVTSLRSVQWESFNVNFFVLASPDVVQDLPKTYITSFYLANPANNFIPSLVREFPSITVINVEALLAQVRQIISRASLAIQYIFLFTLLAGVMVLYAAISASHEERLYEGAILRILGATRRQVLLSLIAEFTTLGLLAGILAASAASGIGYVLAVQVFDLPYHFNGWLWIIGVLGGALGVGLAGVLGTRSLLQRPPLETLRQV